jgi:hypothetical protein
MVGCKRLGGVRKKTGRYFCVSTVCAAGLGQSAVGGVRDRLRLEYLVGIKEQDEALKFAVLQKLGDEYSAIGSSGSSLH